MKKLILVFLLLNTILLSQRLGNRSDERENFLQLKPTVISIPDYGSKINIFYSYRVPYNLLIFQKEGNTFNASFRMLVEVFKGDELIKRDFKDKKITVNDFDVTQSRKAAYEGFVNFNLINDDYTVKGVINDLNSAREIHLSPDEISGLKNVETGIISPIVIDVSDKNCNGDGFPKFVNFGGSIPFSPHDYQLLISVLDTSVEKISLRMKNNEDILPELEITEAKISGITLSQCDDKLFIGKDDNITKTKNFLVRKLYRKLKEGNLILTVISDQGNIEREFPINVVWHNKPISLRNPEIAIEMLQYIEQDDVVKEMLDADEEEYPGVLTEHWKQYDPTPETEYNELMEEYYSRIDYAALEFRAIGRKNGISTDRGKIYIKYGQPDQIERSSNSLGYVVETWIYNNRKQKFLFVDKQGTGNFILIEG